MPRKPYRKFKNRGVSKSLQKYIQKKIEKNIETKHVYAEASATSVSTSVLNTQISTIPQGDDEFRRTGNKVTMTGFYGKFQIVGADTTNVVRIVLYIPKDPDDTLSGLNTYQILDQDRFTILSDRLVTTSSSGVNNKVITIAKKFNRGRRRGVVTQFASSTTTDVAKNALKIAWVSDSAAVSHPTIAYHYVMYFKDA